MVGKFATLCGTNEAPQWSDTPSFLPYIWPKIRDYVYRELKLLLLLQLFLSARRLRIDD